MAEREFTGKHVFLIFGGAFAVIITVNLALAYNAVRTFPGLEVKNSYVASQQFDERRDAQLQLGWSVRADAGEGQVILSITDADGSPVEVSDLRATLGALGIGRFDRTGNSWIALRTPSGEATVSVALLAPCGGVSVWRLVYQT